MSDERTDKDYLTVPLDEADLRAELRKRIAEAEKRMMDEVQRGLYADAGPVLEVDMRRYDRQRFYRRLLAPYDWIRCRIVGIYNVLLRGECGQCEREDW